MGRVDIGGGGGLANVVEDTTPQLGGNLDAQSNDLTSVGSISLIAAGEASLIHDLVDNTDERYGVFNDFSDWVAAVTGTGVTDGSVSRTTIRTGTTAGSTASRKIGSDLAGWTQTANGRVMNWSKALAVAIIITQQEATTNGIFRFTWGKLPATGVGALPGRGIGVQIDNAALKGIVHDGTSGATIDLSTSVVDETATNILITSDGAGNIEWFVNGVSKGTSDGGPTGNSANEGHNMQFEVDNGADSASMRVLGHQVNYRIAQ